jgi:cellulose synthase/poly-beta-1,6-N-acetylglucosamine synthase-like glycosyltransferase
LKALCTLSFAPEEYEIIVVDADASTEVRQQVQQYAQEQQAYGRTIRYLPLTAARVSPAAARNHGWRAARAEIIAFTDDDCIPEMSWLRNGLATFTHEVDVVGGRIVVPLKPLATDYEKTAATINRSEFAAANCFYRRGALERTGGFDERFTAAWCEDSDLFFTLVERDGIAIYEPTATVMHPIRPARWGISLALQPRYRFEALLYKKYPQLYRRYIQSVPPWQYYAITGSLLILLLSLLLQIWLLTILAFFAWCYMSVRYCLQRLHKTSRKPAHVTEVLITSLLIPPWAVFWRLWGACRYRVFFL